MTQLDPDAIDVIFGARRWVVLQGDCADVLDRLPSSSVDSIVCDPPAGIGFMSGAAGWDTDLGGAEAWIGWLTLRLRAALRVLKPGGHALVWALPRTSHWTGRALELAGFEVRDRIAFIFGSGFPKSLDVAKAAPEATAWKGWGTALKPAVEDWYLVRRPPIGSIASNVLTRGTGALNIDGCRVPHISAADHDAHAAGVEAIRARGGTMPGFNASDLAGAAPVTDLGRWPAHLVLAHGPECARIGTRRVKAAPSWNDNRGPSMFTGPITSPVHHSEADGFEMVEAWDCAEGCPVKMLDEQSGVSFSTGGRIGNSTGGIAVPVGPSRKGDPGYGDEGGASRYFTQFAHDDSAIDCAAFFYGTKSSTDERERGCEHLPSKNLTGRAVDSAGTNSPRAGAGRKGERRNFHPTAKSIDLMRWLCRLVTPPDGVVLDMFCGSGSTGVACSAERFRFIGIELDAAYADIARARIVGDATLLNAGGGR